MNLLIVDDHAVVRAGFARLFTDLPKCTIKYAASGLEALSLLRGWDPEVIVLDLNMPGISGFDLLRRIHTEKSSAKILVATMYSELDYVDRAFSCGAIGYITKSAAPDELLNAVQSVYRGDRYIEPSICRDLALRSIDHGESNTPISARDSDILRLLADGQSLSEIAQNLGVSYKTVANNCSRIKSRLGLPRTKDLLRYAIEVNPAQRAFS
jgi:two-component system invasion response regulator UvrY